MRKLIPVISFLIVTGCASQPLNTGNSPSPQPTLTSQPTPSATVQPTITPTQIPAPIPSPIVTSSPSSLPAFYYFNEQKGTFQIEALPEGGKYHLSIYINEDGSGLIVSGAYIIRVNKFNIENKVYSLEKGVYAEHSAVSLDKNGNGLVVLGEGVYGCAGDCNIQKSHLWGIKIENYLPVGDYLIIENSYDIYSTEPFLKVDENGNGKLIYFGTKAYFRNVSNFIVSDQRNDYLEDSTNIKKSEYTDKIILSNRRGATVTSEHTNSPSPGHNVMNFRNIENNIVIDEPVNISLNDSSIIMLSPLIYLNKSGDGLVIYADSFSASMNCVACALGARISVRYISNFNPR